MPIAVVMPFGELGTDPDNLIGEAAGFRDNAEGPFAKEFTGDEVIEGAADHSQAAGARRDNADGRRAVKGLA